MPVYVDEEVGALSDAALADWLMSDDGIAGVQEADYDASAAVGALEDDDIGAVRRPRKRRRLLFKGRRFCPVPETTIPASSTKNVTVTPQYFFQAKKFVIESTNASNFSIQDFLIRNKPQSVAPGTIPGELFLGTIMDTNFVFDPCPPNSDVVIRVTNLTAGDLVFRGVFLGEYR